MKSIKGDSCHPSRKEQNRVVRFLAVGPATPRRAEKKDMLLLDGRERGVISTSAALIAALARSGAVVRKNGCLSLSPAGHALVKRHEAIAEPFQEQHRDLGIVTLSTEEGEHVAQINLAESPLAQLARRRGKNGMPFLDPDEVQAGERLRIDYTRGQIMPRLGANWSHGISKGGGRGAENAIANLTDTALSARQRVDQALSAVGPELASILVDICCFLKGIEQVETEHGWPVRSAKIVLKTALAALSRHYDPHIPKRRRSVFHWGSDDYRPSLRQLAK